MTPKTGINDQCRKARECVYRLLKYRIRSEHELRVKLQERKYSTDSIDEVIAYFKDIDLVDDRRFAQQWISYRLARSFGVNRIIFELKQKGIATEIIQEEISRAEHRYSELNVMRDLISRRLKRYPPLDPIKMKKRIYDFLKRRGFSFQNINRIMKDYDWE